MIEKNATLEAILENCIQTLVNERDFAASINQFLKYVGEYYNANRVYILEFDQKRNIAENTYEWCAEGIAKEIGNLKAVPMEYIFSWIDKLKCAGEVCSSDSAGERLMAVPLYSGSTMIGLMEADGLRRHVKELRLLRLCSYLVMEQFEKKEINSIDALTGLKNYNQYMKDLKSYGASLPPSLGVIYIDVNGMKKINHIYGHEYGDEKLIQIAGVLGESLAADIYRVCGDVFVVLCVDWEEREFREKISSLREKLQEEGCCGVSIGYSWKKNRIDVNGLISNAEEMMHAEKQKYYSALLSDADCKETGRLKGALRKAANDKFSVYYQPQIEFKTNQIIGAEALVRKIDDDGNVILPDKFIPYYEAEGIIRHIDFFVLETVCKDIRYWKSLELHPRISINFSRETLMEPDILKEITDICESYDVSPADITLEVTESVEKMDEKELYMLLAEVSKAGFEVSLDDFGSKYSNLSLLTEMYFDEIKIDKSLVAGIEKNKKSRIIVKNISNMCTELGKTRLLAEGIETKEQKEWLCNYHCEYGQGFYFYHPMPYEKFDEILKAGQ